MTQVSSHRVNLVYINICQGHPPASEGQFETRSNQTTLTRVWIRYSRQIKCLMDKAYVTWAKWERTTSRLLPIKVNQTIPINMLTSYQARWVGPTQISTKRPHLTLHRIEGFRKICLLPAWRVSIKYRATTWGRLTILSLPMETYLRILKYTMTRQNTLSKPNSHNWARDLSTPEPLDNSLPTQETSIWIKILQQYLRQIRIRTHHRETMGLQSPKEVLRCKQLEQTHRWQL